VRRLLYRLGSLLGWLNAAQRGTLPQRFARVWDYKWFSKIVRRLIG
jgi:hypothetical protein